LSVRDAATGNELFAVDEDAVTGVDWSQNGEYVAVESGIVSVYDRSRHVVSVLSGDAAQFGPHCLIATLPVSAKRAVFDRAESGSPRMIWRSGMWRARSSVFGSRTRRKGSTSLWHPARTAPASPRAAPMR
jgi:hypothetical protein